MSDTTTQDDNINVRISKKVKQNLERLAILSKRKVSDYIRLILEDAEKTKKRV